MPTISDDDLKLIFTEAHTHNGWRDEPVDDALLRRIYEIARIGPTGGNTQPLRMVFVKSKAAKERLKPTLSAGNVDKTMAAPVTAIIAHDLEFYEKMPKLFPSRDMRTGLAKLPAEKLQRMAFQGGTLQGAYVIIVARALGLDCGPMGGFDNEKVDAEFLANTKWKSNFLLNLGHGDPAKVFPRNPRLDFDEACRIE